jgi:hypothetical protein
MKIACEIFIAMNEDAGYIVCTDESDALRSLPRTRGGYHARVVKLAVKMSPPQMTEAEVEVPDEAGETNRIETEAA